MNFNCPIIEKENFQTPALRYFNLIKELVSKVSIDRKHKPLAVKNSSLSQLLYKHGDTPQYHLNRQSDQNKTH